MNTVTISPKFQVVIPQNVRKRLNLKVGQKLEVIDYNGRIELIPVVSINELRGVLENSKAEIEREEDRL
ncbi:MAG TPA: AbrB/MazE/SpoVT family DNA-binding domain-containing protein [Candidatus Marinimicrobia bacterium]|nr:AbrB/MazE/SpoVT family DNA-binding domain-containing protein [Candidatus Neomarinimicrobiota bacterium]HRS51608.1 AbrB/MazE/SpoVT family DNA-binding domain-containing protein [Candidatus Neomarinimicrobiota bacterium]HRU92314.1 AbrB/MazE/SpoVT family DNA-binding domain-containing protein [Candidatus Neomarinimicrobiota bacterium]